MQASVRTVDTSTAESESTRVLTALIELGKPRVAALVMVTMLCGALVAPGPRSVASVLVAMFGTAPAAERTPVAGGRALVRVQHRRRGARRAGALHQRSDDGAHGARARQ